MNANGCSALYHASETHLVLAFLSHYVSSFVRCLLACTNAPMQQYSDGNKGDNSSKNAADYQSVNATYVPWLVTYWSTMFLAFTILPLSRETLLSGYFSITSRMRDGCRKAARAYVLMAIVGITSVIVLAVYLRDIHIIPVIMALGNTYGLLLVCLLLGYGLVDLPRRWWRQACPASELRRARIMAGSADEALFDAVWELQDCEESIDAAVSAIEDARQSSAHAGTGEGFENEAYTKCVDKLLKWRDKTATLSPELERRRTASHRRNQDNGQIENNAELMGEDGAAPTIEALAKLGARLKRAQANVVSAEQKWNSLVSRARWFADLTEGEGPPPPDSAVTPRRNARVQTAEPLVVDQSNTMKGKMRYCWTRYFRSSSYRAMGMLTAGMSVMVLWSEATLAIPINLSPFALFLGVADKGERRGILYQVAAMIPLLYMSVCIFSSLFKLSIFGPFCLRGRKQSPGVALVFNAQYLVRLQFPLIYNYLLVLKYDTSSTTCAFSKVMSHMETVPFFGTSFNIYAPLLILAFCAFTLVNGYARLLGLLGFEHEDMVYLSDQETLDSKENEGITLIRRHGERQASRSETEDLKLRSEEDGGGRITSPSFRNGIV